MCLKGSERPLQGVWTHARGQGGQISACVGVCLFVCVYVHTHV